MRYNFKVIGDRIRTVRKEHGLSHESCLEKMKYPMNRRRLSNIEKGKDENFLFDFLKAFAECFDCDIGFLLGEYNERKQETHQICMATGLSEKAVELLSKSAPQYIQTLNSLLENANFWLLLDKIANYRKASAAVSPVENWLDKGIGSSESIITNDSFSNLINKRDFALFQIQNLIQNIAKDGVNNG